MTNAPLGVAYVSIGDTMLMPDARMTHEASSVAESTTAMKPTAQSGLQETLGSPPVMSTDTAVP